MQIPMLGLGEVTEYTLKRLESSLRKQFKNIRIYIGDGKELPEEAYNTFRDQYITEVIMDKFYQDGIQILVTKEDITTRDKNYVFGDSEYRGPAIVSLHRFDPKFYGKDSNEDLLFNRLKKQVVHELGHCFGMEHCENPGCVMQYSSSVRGLDDKSSDFCDECQVKISTKGLSLK